MNELTIILAIFLGLSLVLIIHLAKVISLWREAFYLRDKTCELQKTTINNQQATIDNYKSILAQGITGMIINDKIGAN